MRFYAESKKPPGSGDLFDGECPYENLNPGLITKVFSAEFW
jgi:hypothetical protein